MLGIYVVVLVVAKLLSILEISWSLIGIVSVALILVELRLYQSQKSLLGVMVKLGYKLDKKFEDVEYSLGQKADKDVSRY